MFTVEPVISDQLPLLTHYRASQQRNHPRVPLILVTHILPTSVPFIRALGDDFELVAVFAIPYSYSGAARADLGEIPVIVPKDVLELERQLLSMVEAQNRLGVPFIVQEIGGYLAPAFASGRVFKSLLGVVEDTRQGHWRYEAAAHALTFPVMSIAESPLKALEHHQIGRAVVFSMEHQLRRHFFRSLSGESVAVIGFGDIGSAAANTLRGRQAHVVVHDVDPIRQASAWLQGFRVAGLVEAVRSSNLVLGCSGSRSLSRDVLAQAPDGAVFASGSSKQVEIDVEFFLSGAHEMHGERDLIRLDLDDRSLYLLNEGKPINFRDGSAIGSTLDLVYTELYACTEALAQRRVEGRGLSSLSAGERSSLADTWLSLYAGAHPVSLAHPVNVAHPVDLGTTVTL